MDESQDVDPCIEERISYRTAQIHLGRMMAENVWRDIREKLGKSGIENIKRVKRGLLIYVPLVSGREVVNDE